MEFTAALLSSIEHSASGLSLSQLLTLHPELARRTAQRALAAMITQGVIQSSGDGRARRYSALHVEPSTGSEAFPEAIPVSADSRDVLAYVDRPLQARTPIGYQPGFIDDYLPNHSAYLPDNLRRHLHRVGRTPDIEAAAGTYSRAILNRLLIDLSWASSHLEGNTYSRLDTRQLIEQGVTAQGKPALETQMILNHKSAIELLVENIDSVGLDAYTLMSLQGVLSENLLPNALDEGRVRQHPVAIGQSVYRPLGTPQGLDERLRALLAKAAAISDPFEQSFFVLVHLPYLQPFADMNKRTSRLAANIPLFRANLCPLTFLDVPEQAYSRAVLGVYEMTRVELLRDLFVWAYERSAQEYLVIRQELAEPDPLRLAWRGLIKETVRQVVLQPEQNPLQVIEAAVRAKVPQAQQSAVQATLVEELRRLHEGVLARYGLRPSDLVRWRGITSRGEPLSYPLNCTTEGR